VLTATAFAPDIDITPGKGSSAAAGCAAGVGRLFTRVFFSGGGTGVASSSVRGVSSASGGGFWFGALVEIVSSATRADLSLGAFEISTLGSDVRFFGRDAGVAFTLTEGSKSVGEAASCPRTKCDPVNTPPLQRANRRIPLWKHIKKISAAFRPPQSAIRIPQLCLSFSRPICGFLLLPSYFRLSFRYRICFVPSLPLSLALLPFEPAPRETVSQPAEFVREHSEIGKPRRAIRAERVPAVIFPDIRAATNV
jgi:hypothetical protein